MTTRENMMAEFALSPEVESSGPNTSAITSAVTFQHHSTPESQSSPQSASANRTKKKLKRNRIILSCQPCHRRKQQCDRGQPCQRCVDRGTKHLCAYEQPKELRKRKHVADSTLDHRTMEVKLQLEDKPVINGMSEELTERINQLEGFVSNTLSNLDPTALAGLDALMHLLQAGNSTSSPAGPPVCRSVAPVSPTPTIPETVTKFGAMSPDDIPPVAVMDESPLHPHPFSQMAEVLQQATRGGKTCKIAELSTFFPNLEITDFLLSYFFDESSVQWLWPVIHQPCFQNFYLTFSSGPIPPSIEFTALLAITCATALQFLPESDKDSIIFADYEHGRHVLQQRMYEFARNVLLATPQPPLSSLERIQALTVFALYQWNEGNAAECYYIVGQAIRMAHTLAMNRDGETTWCMRPQDAEIRRRIWWTLFILDRYQCALYGRPYIIQEQHSDVTLPMNLDQVDLRDVSELVPKALDEPTDSLFFLLASRYAQLLGRMWDKCGSISKPTYRTILDIEDEIRQFELDIPASFRYQSSQVASAHPYLTFQNHMLTMGIFHARAVLMRPFLLLRSGKDGLEPTTEEERKVLMFHRHARTICLIFCKRVLAMLQLIQNQVPRAHIRWSALAHLAFDSALMMGLAIIMDPHNPENEEIEEWIAFSQVLLKDMGTYNKLAKSALHHLHIIRSRTRLVFTMAWEKDTPAMSAEPSLQHIARATRILSQLQPCLGDLLGHRLALDGFWSGMRAGVFTSNFPSLESLSGPSNPEALEWFLDNCCTIQLRFPSVCTE